ncbi:hypothetical protein PMAYCL1PPCAC_01003 [Pristionchus mayeri]|uniref:Major facilitator superfamily (MFS) profile domain-containing protein n=1 Tax=Pristionchus mayeri TaxID=1317129 RepID=A0AAN4Z2M4_9BILA|nr:hypothetical protein PMAYCL1PPCAC_01003 [Pristionchus mayeri]
MTAAHPLWSWRSTRLKVALAILLAIYSTVSMRASLSMSIICMVNSTSYINTDDVTANVSTLPTDGCPAREESKSSELSYEGTIDWSPSRQSTLFSATYYGTLPTMLLSGPLADKFGPKRILAGAVSFLVLMSIAAPSLARLDYWVFYVSRVILGMAEGFVQPSANAMGVRWFPPSEKSSMAALYSSGIQIAAGSSNLIGSLLCGVNFLGGWPLIFYLFALIGTLWLVIWLFFVTDHPSQNKCITEEEKEYLEKRVVMKSKEPVSIPWINLLTSREVHACLLCSFTLSFLVSVNQNFLPRYFKEELRLPIAMNGLFTVVPFLSQLIGKNGLARIADHLKASGKMSPTAVVKLFQAIASFGTFIAILSLALLPSCHRPWIAIVIMICYGIVFAGGTPGFMTSLLCIAPAYTGTLFSLSMTCGQISCVLATYVVAFVTEQGWPHKWLIVYSFGATIQLISGVFFLIFGSGEPAEWTKHEIEQKKEPVNEILLNDVKIAK